MTETLPSYTRCTVTWWEDGARCDQQEGHDGDHTYKEHTLVSECAELRAELDAIAAVPEQIRRNITLVADPRWRRLVEQVAELRAERATLAAVRDFATPLQIDHRLGDHTQFSRGWEAAKVRVLAILDGETERPQEADQ